MKKQVKYCVIFILSLMIVVFSLIIIIRKNEYSYAISTELSHENQIEIPVISKLSNTKIQDEINDLLKKSALFYIDTENENDLQLSYDIKRCDEILSVIYYGSIYYPKSIHPINFFYTLNINVENGKSIENDDIFEINSEILLQLLEEKWIYPTELEKKENVKLFLAEEINNNNMDMESGNLPYDNINIYLTDDYIGVRVYLPYAMGSYAVIEIPIDKEPK